MTYPRQAIEACEPLRHLCDALNNDRTFERVMAVIGVAGLVVIGVTL